ncbi:MAG: hypothetical protein KAQ94_04365 [Arcobacteraceae bacterium]|nr:hypothetical protein [Arcobacteraceae bacterium]
MQILIPVDDIDFEEAKITLLDDVKHWILINLEEGRVLEYNFYKTREEITQWIDVVIVKNDKEYVWPFMEENIAVLVAPLQRSVEDIVEAFLFKELHDLNVNI